MYPLAPSAAALSALALAACASPSAMLDRLDRAGCSGTVELHLAYEPPLPPKGTLDVVKVCAAPAVEP